MLLHWVTLFNTKKMKINLLNKLYIGVAVILFMTTIYRIIAYRSWDRYNYSSTIVAPKTYPIYVREAYFLLPDEELESIEEENVNNQTTDWSDYYSVSNHAERALLPSKLVLKYVSYRDRKFYRDTIDLPQQEMKSIFKTVAKTSQRIELSSYGGEKYGLNFTVGIANNGYVVLWLRGINLEKKLLTIRLKGKEPYRSDLRYEKQISKDEYFKMAFSKLSDSVKNLLDGGYDAKANYIDSPSHYIEKNKELWEYQKKNGYIK